MTRTLEVTEEDRLVAWLTALAVTLQVVETALPMPLPGVKPGLANVVTLAVLLRLGWRLAAWVSLLRVLVASLLIGTFLTPTFLLSLTGALAAVGVLGLAWLIPRRPLGPVGYGVLAAMAHMAGQFALAYTLIVPHPALLNILPVLLTVAMIFGVVSGIIAGVMLKGLAPAAT